MAKKTKAEVNSQGQSGPKLSLGVDQLNRDETKIWEAIKRRRGTMEISAMMELFGGSREDRNLTVRNALRRLVRGGFVKRKDRGQFEKSTPFSEKKGARVEAVGRKGTPRGKSSKAKSKAAKTKSPRKDSVPKLVKEEKRLDRQMAKLDHQLVKTEIERLLPDLQVSSKAYKDAALVVAAKKVGIGSSTTLALASGCARGYVIRRLAKHRVLLAKLPSLTAAVVRSTIEKLQAA